MVHYLDPNVYKDQYRYGGRAARSYNCSDGGTCIAGVGSQGPYCNENLRDPKLTDGAKCNVDNDCLSGLCSQGCNNTGNVCAPYKIKYLLDWAHGHGIMKDPEVCKKYGYTFERDPVVQANKRPPYAVCGRDSDCQSGYHCKKVGGYPICVQHTCLPNNIICKNDDECCSGFCGISRQGVYACAPSDDKPDSYDYNSYNYYNNRAYYSKFDYDPYYNVISTASQNWCYCYEGNWPACDSYQYIGGSC